jgi:hypothetical protein
MWWKPNFKYGTTIWIVAPNDINMEKHGKYTSIYSTEKGIINISIHLYAKKYNYMTKASETMKYTSSYYEDKA